MIMKTKDGREVEASFYGPSDDVQCDSAVYTDTGEDVEDNVLDELMHDYASDIDMDRLERSIMAAEYAFEGDR